jgi:drug/metabolite transporter (DMT)-like permease
MPSSARSRLPWSVPCALLSALLFGAATPASKALLGSLSAFQLAGLLYLGGAAGVLVSLFRNRSWRSPIRMSPGNRRHLAGAIVFGGILGPVLLLFGLKLASAASVSLWLNLEVVATALLGLLIFRDHLGRWGWVGLIGIVGAGALLSSGEGVAGVRAGLLVAGACLCWGLDNHFTAVIDGITPAQSTFWKGIVAGSVNLAIGFVLSPHPLPASVAALGLLVGALAYGASITLYITAAQGMGATRAQMIFASAPFFGMILSAAFLHEPLARRQILAACVQIASLGALFRDRHEHVHAHEAMAHEHVHRHDDGHHDHAHPDGEPASRHAHWHEHEPTTHAHPHWPDLHHRHGHRHG